MEMLPHLDAAFGAFGDFLREVLAEIGDMAEVEAGTTKGAVSVSRYHVFRGAKELSESVV